jgi:hypothetical protein
MYIVYVNTNMEKAMIKKQLKDLGFKKIKTEPGFFMYELDPATLRSHMLPATNHKLQAASHKLQATSVLTKLNNVLYRIHESKRFR